MARHILGLVIMIHAVALVVYGIVVHYSPPTYGTIGFGIPPSSRFSGFYTDDISTCSGTLAVIITGLCMFVIGWIINRDKKKDSQQDL